MKAAYAIYTGRMHAENQAECQDFAMAYHDPNLSAIGVSDGCTNAEYGKEGAQLSVEAALEFVADTDNWHKPEREDIINSLVDAILAKFKASGYPIDELSATLCVAAIKADGEYLVISIGDSTVIAYNNKLEPMPMMKPYNSGNKSCTVFTKDREGCVEHGKVAYFNLDSGDFAGFAIYTDGCEGMFSKKLYEGGRLLRQAAAHTVLEDDPDYFTTLMRRIAETETNDDVSLAILLREDEALIQKAGKILREPEPDTDETQDTEPDPHPIMYRALLKALADHPMTPQELTNGGYVPSGKILETLMPLIKDNTIRWEDGAFYLSV